MNRRALAFALRITVSLVLLALLTLVVAEPRALGARLATMSGVALALAFLLTAADRVVMALKWRLLVTVRGIRVPIGAAVRAYFVSSFAGLFLPVTVGADAVRIVALRQYGTMAIAASIAVERVVGALAVVAVALAGLALLAGAVSDVAFGPIVTAIVVIGGAVTIAFPASLWIAGRVAARRAADASLISRVATAYGAYASHPFALTVFFLLSVGESLVPAAIAFVIARGLDVAAPVWLFVAVMPAALMIARLPVSLGGFGVQETSFVYLARLAGMPPSDAVAIMLVLDAVLVLTLLPAAFDVSILKRQQPT